jgi:hypothetical protein
VYPLAVDRRWVVALALAACHRHPHDRNGRSVKVVEIDAEPRTSGGITDLLPTGTCCAARIDGVNKDVAQCSYGLDCDRAQVRIDASGQLVAIWWHDSMSNQGWSLVQVVGNGDTFRDCTDLGSDAEPHFDRVEPLLQSWSRILACRDVALSARGELTASIITAIANRNGDAVAVDLALTLGSAHTEIFGDNDWELMMPALPDVLRTQIMARFCHPTSVDEPAAVLRHAVCGGQ